MNKVSYIDRINSCFSEIKIESKSDCENYISAALAVLLNNDLSSHDVTIKKVFTPIKEIYDHPENYVKEKDYKMFKMLVTSRVAQKIHHLQILSERFDASPEVAKEPVSLPSDNWKAYTLDDYLVWLDQILQDPSSVHKIGLGPFKELTNEEEFCSFVSQTNPELLRKFFFHILLHLEAGNKLDSIWNLNDNRFFQTIQRADVLFFLKSIGITLEKLKGLSEDTLMIILNNVPSLIFLFRRGKVSFEELTQLSNYVLATILGHPKETDMLLCMGFPVTEFAKLELNTLNETLSLENVIAALFLRSSGISVTEFFNLNLTPQQRDVWKQNAISVGMFHKEGISLTMLKDANLQRLELIFSNIMRVLMHLSLDCQGESKSVAFQKLLHLEEDNFRKIVIGDS